VTEIHEALSDEFHSTKRQTVIFFREGFFYPVMGRPDEDWSKHAELNPGTLRIESMDGEILWRPQ
jgi:hypothetical protein